MRRLPIYIVVDSNIFNTTQYVSIVEAAIKNLLDSWKDNPWILEVATVSVISGNTVNLCPSDIYDIDHIGIASDTETTMDATLELLTESLNNNIVKTTIEYKGDWKPLILFFITDNNNIQRNLIHHWISDFSSKNRMYSNSIVVSFDNYSGNCGTNVNNINVVLQVINHNPTNDISVSSSISPPEWNSFWTFVAESYSNVSGNNLSIGFHLYRYHINIGRQTLELSFTHP